MKLDISILQRLLWLRPGRITPKAYRRPSAWSGYGVRGHIPSLFITLTGLSVSSRLPGHRDQKARLACQGMRSSH